MGSSTVGSIRDLRKEFIDQPVVSVYIHKQGGRKNTSLNKLLQLLMY